MENEYDIRLAFNAVDGVLSNNMAEPIASKLTLEFLDADLMKDMECFKNAFDCHYLDIKYKLAEGSDSLSIDFKKAGKRLGKDMKIAKAAFDKGDIGLFLVCELITATKFKRGLLAYNDTIRVHLEFAASPEIAEYNQVLEFRRELKKYITETLGINIVPNIWRSPDDPALSTRVLSVTLCDCTESLYQACHKFAPKIFANTLFNFTIPSRFDLHKGVKGNHKLSNARVSIEDK